MSFTSTFLKGLKKNYVTELHPFVPLSNICLDFIDLRRRRSHNLACFLKNIQNKQKKWFWKRLESCLRCLSTAFLCPFCSSCQSWWLFRRSIVHTSSLLLGCSSMIFMVLPMVWIIDLCFHLFQSHDNVTSLKIKYLFPIVNVGSSSIFKKGEGISVWNARNCLFGFLNRCTLMSFALKLCV